MATIADYLERYATVLRRSGPNVFIECPACGTRKAKCAVHTTRAVGNCFRASCALNGGFSFVSLICRLQTVGYSEALGIAARFSDDVEREYVAQSYGTNRNYPEGSLPIQELLNRNRLTDGMLAQHGVDYLVEKRKLTGEQIEAYQLGIGYRDVVLGMKHISRYGMIIIPVTFNGELVSYCARSIEYMGTLLAGQKHHTPDPVEGYLTSGQVLFNCDTAIPLARERGYLPIVEDPWSAIKLDAVATLGSNLTADQLYILQNNFRGAVVVVRDNDAGGRKAAQQDVEKLSRCFDDVRVVTPTGCDPDDDLEATKRLIAKSRPLDLFQQRLSLSLKR